MSRTQLETITAIPHILKAITDSLRAPAKYKELPLWWGTELGLSKSCLRNNTSRMDSGLVLLFWIDPTPSPHWLHTWSFSCGHSFTLQSCSQVRCHWPQHLVVSVSWVQSHHHHEFYIIEVISRMTTESHKLKRNKFKREVWMTKLISFHETFLASALFLYELHTNFNFVYVNIYHLYM